jgi:hypothetical protein
MHRPEMLKQPSSIIAFVRWHRTRPQSMLASSRPPIHDDHEVRDHGCLGQYTLLVY